MKKRILSLLLALCMVCSLLPGITLAASNKATEAADALYELGLFSGTGTDASGKPIYDLDRAPTRQEAIVMLVRLLGKVDEATNGSWKMPFTDVSDWAKPYVGYAYTNGLAFGVSETAFGSGDIVSASQYLTFALRALGYESGTDFQWDKAWELSDKIGMTSGEYNGTSNFLRGDVAIVSYNTLHTNKKGTTTPLVDTLSKQSNQNLYSKENLQGAWRFMTSNYCVEFMFDGSNFIKSSLDFSKTSSNDIVIDGQTFLVEDIKNFALSSGNYEAYEGSISWHTLKWVTHGVPEKADHWINDEITFLDKDTFRLGFAEYKRVPSAIVTSYCKEKMPTFFEASESSIKPEEKPLDYSYLAVNDFVSIKNAYSNATPITAYQTQYTNLDGELCVITDVWYKIISNYHHCTLYNVNTGRLISDPDKEFSTLISRNYGSEKLRYMNLRLEFLEHYANALDGKEGKTIDLSSLG